MRTGDCWICGDLVTCSINSVLAHRGPGLRGVSPRDLSDTDHQVALPGCGPEGPREGKINSASSWIGVAFSPAGPEESPAAGLGVQEELGAKLELCLQSTLLSPSPQNCC